VKPEGFPVEKVQNIFQCRTQEETEEVVIKLEDLALPEDLVEGSERAYVKLLKSIKMDVTYFLGESVWRHYGSIY